MQFRKWIQKKESKSGVWEEFLKIKRNFSTFLRQYVNQFLSLKQKKTVVDFSNIKNTHVSRSIK